jgi:hypothetical protein
LPSFRLRFLVKENRKRAKEREGQAGKAVKKSAAEPIKHRKKREKVL